jgi:hypothetical protein
MMIIVIRLVSKIIFARPQALMRTLPRTSNTATENVEDDPRSGRPVSSTNDKNVEVVRAVMAKDRRLSVRMIAEETGVDKNAVHRIQGVYGLWFVSVISTFRISP